MIKKLIIYITFLFFSISLFSCKKHTCECISTRQYYQPGEGPTVSVNYFKGSKSRVKKQCESLSSSKDNYGNETVCTLK
jgi:hypothetical protein